MELKIQEVALEHVNLVWDHIERYIEEALGYSCGDYCARDARVLTTNGTWNIIVASDDTGKIHGAAVVSYFNRPEYRVAFVIAIGGKLIANRAAVRQFEEILRARGATYLEGAGRDSIVRLWFRYGLEKKYTVIGKEL